MVRKTFEEEIERVVRSIPRGTTLSYGEVALRAGKPRAARAVSRALGRLDVAWWRVARRDGTLAPQVSREQEQLLRQEGWKPRQRAKRKATQPGAQPARRPAKVKPVAARRSR